MKCPKCKQKMHFMSAIDIPKEKDLRYSFFICIDCDIIKFKKINLAKADTEKDFY